MKEKLCSEEGIKFRKKDVSMLNPFLVTSKTITDLEDLISVVWKKLTLRLDYCQSHKTLGIGLHKAQKGVVLSTPIHQNPVIIKT